MKIITGSKKGIWLDAPKGETTRPTSQRVKEAVFSALQFEIEGACVLDAFAGSGQLSLEALSRGAKKAVLAECDSNALKVIHSNIKKLSFEKLCTVLSGDILKNASRVASYAPYDIVFLDPPYKSDLYEKTVKMLLEKNMLTDNSKIVCEVSDKMIFPDIFNKFSKKEYKHGNTKIVIFRNIMEEADENSNLSR